MQNYTITSKPSPEEVIYLNKQLTDYNKTQTATPEIVRKHIALVCKDDNQKIIGGAIAYIYLDALNIDTLWIEESLRKSGVGSKLLKILETEAKAMGCALMQTDTFTFQAPEFYLKHGFQVFGTLSGFAGGYQRFYLVKGL